MSVSALSSSASSMPALLQLSGGKPPVQDTQGEMPPPRGPGGKEKMESLLSSQVQSGNLTQDQADTLKGFFESLAIKGPRSTEGPNGPRPPRDKDGDRDGIAEGAGDKDVVARSNPASNAASKSVSDALAAFLKNLQDPNGSSSGYGAPAKTATTPSLVLDQKV